jgi:hypothetical protein
MGFKVFAKSECTQTNSLTLGNRRKEETIIIVPLSGSKGISPLGIGRKLEVCLYLVKWWGVSLSHISWSGEVQ